MAKHYSTTLRSAVLAIALLHAVGCDDDDDPREPLPDASSDAATQRPDAQTSDASSDASVQVDSSQPDASQPSAADTWALSSTGRLLHFTRATGSIAEARGVTGIAAGDTIVGADIRPANGSVVVLTKDASNVGKLYTVDAATAVATLKASLSADSTDTSEAYAALAGTSFGVDFNPVADRLRVVSDTGQNLRINPESGATITDGVLAPATPGVSAAAYTESFAAACRTRLFVIDSAQKKLLLQDPPNDGKLSEVASLGELGSITGFDIQTSSAGANVAFVGATASDGQRVAALDLATGAVSASVSLALDAGETLRAVFAEPPASAPAQARGELLATTASNKLISFNRGAPGKLCTTAAITGLAAGENVLGADVRPADKALYALGSTGKLYTVALDSAAATLKSTLSPADGDSFSALEATQYAVGFNPVPDRLRVISASGTNLRINVDDGKVTTDVSLSAGSVSAAGYTNSFAGTKSTTLFAIDASANTLVRIGGAPAGGAACPNDSNPNCGVVASLGALGVDISAINGFDIDASNGVALGAFQVGDATTSTLLAVNLSTGAAALPAGTANGTIGGGELVTGLTFAAAPTLTAWAATTDGKLVAFAPSAPATALKTLTVSGLESGETLVGIDVRPLDAKLYGVGSNGRLYALDTETGAASATATLAAAANASFTSLPTANYGFDFNPAADALRLVDDAEDNFRILPSTRTAGAAGTTFVDTALTPAGDVSAAAYTQSYAGSTTTTLYVVDTVAGQLLRQGGLNGDPSPNGGALTGVGALGVSSTSEANFDIIGGHDGAAIAAIASDDGNTALYTVNLGSGAATPYNTGANAVTGRLRGLALTLR